MTPTKTRRTPRLPKLAAPTTSAAPTTETPRAARMLYGDVTFRARFDAMIAAFPLLATYATRAADASRGAPAFYAANFTTNPSDVPALLNLAARLCVSVGATVTGFDLDSAPAADALDPLSSFYFISRNRHPASQHVSDTDRRDVASRVAAALIANADRLTNRTTPREFGGQYGTRDAHAHVIHGIAAVLPNLLAAHPS